MKRIVTWCLVLSAAACGPREVRTREIHVREVPPPGEHRVGPGEVPETVRRAQEGEVPKVNVSPQDAVVGGDLEERSSLARAIWASPLGRMYSDYLFSRSTPIENLRKVTKIVERLFSDPLWTVNRVSGVQLMTEDLYNTGRVDPTINDRIGLLMLNLSLKRHALEVESARQLGWQTPAIAVVGFLAGSPLVRRQVGLVTEATRHSAKWVVSFGARKELLSARRAVQQLDWRGLLTNDFWDKYSVWNAALYGAGTFAAYAPFYYGLRTGSADSASPTQKTLIYNLQQLIDLSKM